MTNRGRRINISGNEALFLFEKARVVIVENCLVGHLHMLRNDEISVLRMFLTIIPMKVFMVFPCRGVTLKQRE